MATGLKRFFMITQMFYIFQYIDGIMASFILLVEHLMNVVNMKVLAKM